MFLFFPHVCKELVRHQKKNAYNRNTVLQIQTMNIQYRVQSQGQMLIQFLAPLLSLSLRSCSQPLRLNFFIL